MRTGIAAELSEAMKEERNKAAATLFWKDFIANVVQERGLEDE